MKHYTLIRKNRSTVHCKVYAKLILRMKIYYNIIYIYIYIYIYILQDIYTLFVIIMLDYRDTYM